jgi:cephalosporin-C deacetylase-like acetyl esterase
MISRRALFRLAAVWLIFARNEAIAGDAIVLTAQLPETIPWDLKKLSEPPTFEWVDDKGPVRSLFYEGETYGDNPTRVFAYYGTPATARLSASDNQRFPAVVLLHGGGGTAYREWVLMWAKRGYAAIAMDLAGHRPLEGVSPHDLQNRARLVDGGPDQGPEEKFGNIGKALTTQWTYHAVAAAIRAHSLIRSFPEVDPERTAVTGISWGGYLTAIVAGVDGRFKAAVPVYGCGFLHENSAWLNHFARMTAQQRDQWVKLWDPSIYLPSVKMPILFINGTNDSAYPLDSYMKSYAAVPGTKQLRITVNMPHSHQDGWAPVEIGRFIDSYLRGGHALPKAGKLETVGKKIKLEYTSAGKVTAQFHFTISRGPINKLEWRSTPAIVSAENITADAPPHEAIAWFFTLTDDEGATISSEVVFKEGTSTTSFEK